MDDITTSGVYKQVFNNYSMTKIEENVRATTEYVYLGAFTSAP